MPGPGGPPGHHSADSVDNFKEQVMLATLPDSNPDVHLVRLHIAAGVLRLRQACVSPAGGVSLEAEHSMPLGSVTLIPSGDLSLTLQQENGQAVQLHFENQDDERSWTKALSDVKAAVGSPHGLSTTATVDTRALAGVRDDIPSLKARSAALQDRIGTLEALRERRDKQLEALTSRLEDALKMLGAVQDMCCQQKKVIDAQQTAIIELRRDAGLASDDELISSAKPSHLITSESLAGRPELDTPCMPCAQTKVPVAAVAHTPSVAEVAESLELDMPAEAEEMLKLLQQADEMQQALRQLQALSGGACGGQPGHCSLLAQQDSSAEIAGRVQVQGEDEGHDETHEQDDNEQVLNRIRSLETEKERFEAMIRDSQNEHDELMQQLHGMRSLMSMLGIKEEELAEPEEEDAGGQATGIFVPK